LPTLLKKLTNIPKKSCQFCIPQLLSLTLHQSRSKFLKTYYKNFFFQNTFLFQKDENLTLKVLNVHAVGICNQEDYKGVGSNPNAL